MRRYAWLGLFLAFALVAAACGGGGAGETTTTKAPETTTTAAPSGGGETTTTAPPPEIKAGIGVDVESKTINIGMLPDLTGIFSSLVTDTTDAQIVFWDNVNADGGIDGWTVNLVIEDTNYNVEQHLEKYQKIRNDVLFLSTATGSPTNVAALPQYIEDDMVFSPLSFYSGWAIPEFDQRLALEKYTNYCIEAINAMSFMKDQGATKVAIATFPGDYGGDGAAGARIGAEAVGLAVVYDGEGAVIPGQDQTPVISEIVNSGAEWIYFVTSPGTTAEILGGVVAAGADVKAMGAYPAFDFRLLDSPVAQIMDERYFHSTYTVPWGEDAPMNQEMMAALREAYPDRRPADAFIQGWHEGIIAYEVLKRAIANGDLTRKGIIEAANSLEEIDFGGSAANQRYAGTPNEYVTRATAIYRPSLEKYLAAGGPDQTMSQEGATTGMELVRGFTVSDAAANFDFSEPCYSL